MGPQRAGGRLEKKPRYLAGQPVSSEPRRAAALLSEGHEQQPRPVSVEQRTDALPPSRHADLYSRSLLPLHPLLVAEPELVALAFDLDPDGPPPSLDSPSFIPALLPCPRRSTYAAARPGERGDRTRPRRHQRFLSRTPRRSSLCLQRLLGACASRKTGLPRRSDTGEGHSSSSCAMQPHSPSRSSVCLLPRAAELETASCALLLRSSAAPSATEEPVESLRRPICP